jgi:hypothetical protein
MPLIYGEGEKAFTRLQEEIIKTVAAQSIFAWARIASTDDTSGPLAQSPAQFVRSGSFVPHGIRRPCDSFSMTNRGLQIELFLSPVPEQDQVWKCYLACASGSDHHQVQYIFLRCLFGDSSQTVLLPQYQRIRPHILRVGDPETDPEGQYEKVHFVRNVQMDMQSLWTTSTRVPLFVMPYLPAHVVDWFPRNSWDPQMKLFRPQRKSGILGVILVHGCCGIEYFDSICRLILKITASPEPSCAIFRYQFAYNLEEIYFDNVPSVREATAKTTAPIPGIVSHPWLGKLKKTSLNGHSAYEVLVEGCERPH